LIPGVEWKDGLLRFSFWAMNGGLMAMCVLSLLPVGLMQTWASVEHGYWYARSGEFLQSPIMQTLRWFRVPGDTVFAAGAVALAIFVAGLKTGHSFKDGKQADGMSDSMVNAPGEHEEAGAAAGSKA
jgi:nitric oxide reductase subunit B